MNSAQVCTTDTHTKKLSEHPNYPDIKGQKGNKYSTEFGARRIAEIVLAELKNQNIELAERIVKPKAKS